MKRIEVLLVLMLFTLPLASQPSASLAPLLKDNPEVTATAEARLSSLMAVLGESPLRNDRAFLHRIFNQTQHRFLKKYVAYSEFADLFSTGNYDCLTATALFSVVLDQYHFDYSLLETNYHIFLVVHTRRGDVLIETTDKVSGFVTGETEIQERIGTYRENQLTASIAADKKPYLYHISLYRELTPAQLPGLLYFNQAIRAFNNQEWELCAVMIDRASVIYDTPRIGELASILVRAVADHEKDPARKKEIISRLNHYFTAKTIAGL